MKLTPIQKLDEVLKIIAPKDNNPATSVYESNIISILKTSFDVTDAHAIEISNQMPQILEKLIKDGYIVLDTKRIEGENLGKIGKKSYLITFEGEVFNEEGGYKQKYINENDENIRLETLERFQKVNAHRMTCLTIVLVVSALVAAIYYLTELYWQYHWFH